MSTISSVSLHLGLVTWTALGLSGCSSDAAVQPPDTGDCPARTYRISSIEIPLGALDAITAAFDLDGDGIRDNALGLASAVLHAWSPAFVLAPVIDPRLARELDWRLELHQCTPGGAAAVALVQGGPESDEASSAAVIEATGDHAPGGTPLTGGTFAIPLGAMSDALGGAPAGWIAAPLAQLRLDAIDDAVAHATVGLAVTLADVIAVVAPNLAAYFTAQLAEGDSDFALDADRDGDRVVTAEELMASDTAQILLAPDLDDQPALAGDDGLSLGFRIIAIRN